MSFTSHPNDGRFWDLLELHLVGNLSTAEQAELNQLVAELPAEQLTEWEHLTGLVFTLPAISEYQELPPELAVRIHAEAPKYLPGASTAAPTLLDSSSAHSAVAAAAQQEFSRATNRPQTAPHSAIETNRSSDANWFRELGPWMVAAASIFVAFLTLISRGSSTGDQSSTTISQTVQKTPAQDRAELLAIAAEQPDRILNLPWTSTMDPAANAATGDIVWDNSQQRGYMRFRGLAKNNPTQNQYQLWIFDKAQDEKYPIDGGVFDIDSATGDVIVPILAKIKVQEPTLFAITVEKPGGVVVSSRERLPLLAKVP